MELQPQPVAGSLDELLGGAFERRSMAQSSHGLSGASFERVTIDGEPHVLKYVHPDEDWIMRATSDLTGRPGHIWRTGLATALPDCLDTAMVGCAMGLGRNGWGTAVLMRDIGDCFTSETDDLVPTEQHDRFIDHMARMHAHFWGFEDPVELTSIETRYFVFSPWVVDTEGTRTPPEPIPRAAGEGWANLRQVSPRAADVVDAIFHEPRPLVDAMEQTPCTLVHGDWKYGNLGSHPDGRTTLVDWAFPGRAPACADLAWYLGTNCARMPRSKEDTIAAYRAALESLGIATEPWWDAQLGLTCMGFFLQQGWHKGMSGPDDDEFRWWEERTLDAVQYLR
jgi:Phosphotransferase enzyme family